MQEKIIVADPTDLVALQEVINREIHRNETPIQKMKQGFVKAVKNAFTRKKSKKRK